MCWYLVPFLDLKPDISKVHFSKISQLIFTRIQLNQGKLIHQDCRYEGYTQIFFLYWIRLVKGVLFLFRRYESESGNARSARCHGCCRQSGGHQNSASSGTPSPIFWRNWLCFLSLTNMKHGTSHNDSFAAMESAGRLIRSLGNGELLKQCVRYRIIGMHFKRIHLTSV